jgi:CBS domain-containing protein
MALAPVDARVGKERVMSDRFVRDVMTREVVTATPSTPFEEIAEMLASHRIGAVPVADHARRLRYAPVVDGAGRLIGIVARSDLPRPFAMDDDAPRPPILSEILDARLGLRWDIARVEVAGGVVTPRGRLERRVEAVAVHQVVEAQPGVVAVDLLTYVKDDGLDDLLPPGGEVDAGRKTRW